MAPLLILQVNVLDEFSSVAWRVSVNAVGEPSSLIETEVELPSVMTGAELVPNVAVTVEFADIVKVQVLVLMPLQTVAPPVPLLQPTNVDPEAAVAVRVTLVPFARFLEQLEVEPVEQLIRGFVFDTTLPEPDPARVTRRETAAAL